MWRFFDFQAKTLEMSNWLFPENNGEQDWPSGCSLQYVSGDKLTNQTQIPVPPLPAMAQTDGKFKIKSNASQKDIAFSISWIDVTRSNRFIQYKMEFGDVTWCTFWRADLVNCSSWGRWHFDCYPNDWPNVKIFKILGIRGIDLSKFKIPIYPISVSFDFVGTILLIPPSRLHIF